MMITSWDGGVSMCSVGRAASPRSNLFYSIDMNTDTDRFRQQFKAKEIDIEGNYTKLMTRSSTGFVDKGISLRLSQYININKRNSCDLRQIYTETEE